MTPSCHQQLITKEPHLPQLRSELVIQWAGKNGIRERVKGIKRIQRLVSHLQKKFLDDPQGLLVKYSVACDICGKLTQHFFKKQTKKTPIIPTVKQGGGSVMSGATLLLYRRLAVSDGTEFCSLPEKLPTAESP